jgi:hypothetical protein
MNGVEQLLPADPAVSNLIDDEKIATVEQQSAVQPTGAAVAGAMAQQASAEVKSATDNSSTESSLSQPPALAVIASSTVSVQHPQMLPAPAVEGKRGGAVPRDSIPTGISKDGFCPQPACARCSGCKQGAPWTPIRPPMVSQNLIGMQDFASSSAGGSTHNESRQVPHPPSQGACNPHFPGSST